MINQESTSGAGAELHFVVPLPPSVNKLYIRRRGGGLALGTDAKKFKEGFKQVVVANLPKLYGFPVGPENTYEVRIDLYFPKLENPGWFKVDKKGQRQAKSRYKMVDCDNRVKFLQDCLTELVGIPDDSQIFRGIQQKHEDVDNPRAEILLRVLEGG